MRMKNLAVVMVALCPLLGGPACNKKSDKPADKPGPTAATPGDKPKAVPGTEGLRSLLAGAGKEAAPKQGSLGSLGGILGGMGGGGNAFPGGGSGGTGAMAVGEEGKMGKKGIDKEDIAEADQPSGAEDIKLPPPAAKGGDCSAVATRIGGIARLAMQAELKDMSDDERKMAEGFAQMAIQEVERQMTEMCQKTGWTQELRDCVLVAADIKALERCEQLVTPEMKQKMAEVEGGEPPDDLDPPDEVPTGPPPKWDGAKSDCGAVADHVIALALHEMGDDPATKEAAAAMMGEVRKEIEKQCADGNWPEAARLCILKSSSVESMDACSSQIPGGGAM